MNCLGCEAPSTLDFCAACCPQLYCQDCKDATGGQCRVHYEPECTCYEHLGGHQMGCPFYGRKQPADPGTIHGGGG